LRAVFITLSMSCLAFAQNTGSQKFQLKDTQRLSFPPGGVLHVVDSIDELTVEGWDRPDVQITTTKTTRNFYNSEDRDRAERELARLRITAERREDEVRVSAASLRRRGFPFVLFFGLTDFDLECRIKVPYAARVTVEHAAGEVHLENIAGDIHATVRRGGITLALPEEGQYTIDAKSSFGGVVSDFVGETKHTGWIVGNRFMQERKAGPPKVYLRVGYGDILILKEPRTCASGWVK
jgi:hypothetical protein